VVECKKSCYLSAMGFAFGKKNYIILAVGLLLLFIGYLLMSGGAATSADEFNSDELFSARRITLAPIVVLLGYVVVGVAIMYREKK
jgi:Protein of unknown function (DUF3098)